MIKDLIKRILSMGLIFQYIIYKIKINILHKNEVLIFNTPNHGNLGDHAIILAEEQMFKNLKIPYFEIPTFKEKYIFKFIKKYTKETSLICITGGGFIGTQWIHEMNLVNKVFDNYDSHPIILFPQTFYFSEEKEEDLIQFEERIKKCKNITIFAREKKSFNLLKDKLKLDKVYLVPDIVLYLKGKINVKQNQNSSLSKSLLMCLRKDVEKNVLNEEVEKYKNFFQNKQYKIEFTDTVRKKRIYKRRRKREIIKKINQISNYDIMITDRLHGMIFAVLANTPCLVLSNYNYKISGVYDFIKDFEKVMFIHHALDLEERNEKARTERKYE